MTIRRKSIASYILAWGNLFGLIANMGARYIGAQNRAELDRLKAENLALRNQIAAQQIGQAHNKVVEGDLKIELLNLRIAAQHFKNDAQGIGAPAFKAEDYAEPGDIRRGVLPPE